MKDLKLNNLSKNKLEKKELNNARGGQLCGCGCYYSGSGGSSSNDNGCANADGGMRSPERQE